MSRLPSWLSRTSADGTPLTGHVYNVIAFALVAFIPLSLTSALWERERARAQADARAEFEFLVRETTETVRARMLTYEQVLRGGAALFSTNAAVTRGDWRNYVQLLNVLKNHPGMAAMSYIPVVPADGLAAFVANIKQNDVPGYKVWPQGDRKAAAPTLYIEPFTDRNLSALGFDLYSDPVRLAALETARDTGEATLTARITLSQDAMTTPQPSVAMYVPIYRRGTDSSSLNERRAALTGFVSTGFRVNDLLAGVLRERLKLDVKIFDGRSDAGDAPLAQRRASAEGAVSAPKFVAHQRLDLHNRIWTLSFESTPAFELETAKDKSQLILVGGLLFSALLVALIWLLASTRNRALKLATKITAELHLKQVALTASEERLNLALQGSDLALFDWSLPADRVELSEQWARMLGHPPHATTMSGNELARLVHPNDELRVQSKLRALLSGAEAFYQVEHRVKTQQGEWLWILSRARVVERDQNGRALRVAGTNADITARKLVEQMKTEFVGNVSHELRTPLTVIVGSLELLKVYFSELTPDQKEMLDMACESSARLQTLVNDILDFERITSGTMVFDLQQVLLPPFLHRALELNRVYADRFKVRYELSGPIPAVSVHADRERLMQVLTNLLSNAAKFSPEGAAVTISASHNGEWVRISVTDSGPGIPLEFRGRIFQKFAQADASDGRPKGGTGLGLSICKAILENMGGRIDYESEPGRGATFYIELLRSTDFV